MVASIIKPPPGLVITQPNTVTRIANTPLTVGLVDVMLPMGGNVQTVLCGGGFGSPPFVASGTPTWTTNSKFGSGMSFTSPAYTTRAMAPSLASTVDILNECTVMALLVPTSVTTASAGIFTYSNAGSGTPLLIMYQWASGSISMWSRDAGSNAKNTGPVTPGSGWANNTPALVVMTRSAVRNKNEIWLNGASIFTGTLAANTTATTFNRATVAWDHNNAKWSGSNYLTCVWNRALSPAEIVEVSANPWQIFESVIPRFIVPDLGGGGGVGSSTGTSTVSGIGASTSAQVGSSTGTSTVSGIGAETSAQVGSSTGTSTVSATGASTSAQVGNATGTSTADSVSAVTLVGVGNADGTSTVSGISPTIVQAIGAAIGVGMAFAVSEPSESGGKGGYAGDLYYYKKRKKAPVQERADEAIEAFEQLKALVQPEASVYVDRAQREAALAIDKLEARREIGEGIASMLAEVERAVEIFQKRLRQQAEEDEEEEIALIMAALQD